MVPPLPGRFLRAVAAALALTLVCPVAPSLADAGSQARLQRLLSAEVLYHSQLKDYFAAITRLQLAYEKGALPQKGVDGEILLTRLKLAYGLRGDAETAFRQLLDERVGEAVRNRAWYELARAFFHKTQPQAAMAALDNVRGALPLDIRGDHQLLRAHILLALQRHSEAAALLDAWRGEEALRGYAYYNRGIALVRAAKFDEAILALESAVNLPASGEELMALRDRARLTLGYALIRQGDLDGARTHLQRVRLHGASSNQALLTLGWIARQQGRTEDALAPWVALSGRTLADPAVQESLLAVPSVHQELRAPGVAAQYYEVAVDAFSRELSSVNSTMELLRRGQPLFDLLPAEAALDTQKTPQLGPMLASRVFEQTSRDRADLQAMVEHLSQGLRSVERLAVLTRPATSVEYATENGAAPFAPPDRPNRATPGRTGSPAVPQSAIPGSPWQRPSPEGRSSTDSPRGAPILPQIEPPLDRNVRGLPDSNGVGLPKSEWIGFPASGPARFPTPEVTAFPESKVIGFPEAGIVRIPSSDDDFAYPDDVISSNGSGRPPGALSRQLIGGEEGAPAAEPVATAHTLAEVSKSLATTRERMRQLVSRFKLGARPGGELEAHIAGLRQRILQLLDRTAAAIALYEQHATALALEELARSQSQLEYHLEQARLELAKSYDAATAQ